MGKKKAMVKNKAPPDPAAKENLKKLTLYYKSVTLIQVQSYTRTSERSQSARH